MDDNKSNIVQIIKKGIAKTILWLSIFILTVFVLALGALQIPFFQTKLSQEFASILSERIGFEIRISHAQVRWFDTVVLKEVNIRDSKDSSMIHSEELMIKFRLRALLNNSTKYLDRVNLKGGQVNLIRDKENRRINITRFIWELKELTRRKDKKSAPFAINEIILEDVSVHMNDQGKDTIFNRFDYHHFQINNVHATISDFKVKSDTVIMDINEFRAIEPSYDLNVDKMNSHFELSNRFLSLTDLNLSIGNSLIRDSIRFEFNGLKNLAYFIDSVEIKSSLNESILYSQDLGLFATYFNQYKEYYKVSGNVSGGIRSLSVNDLLFYFGNNGKIVGDLNFYGLPAIDQTFMDLRLKNSRLNTQDLKKYIPLQVYDRLSSFGRVQFSSQFLGFKSDFVADGKFRTDIGFVDADLNLKIERNEVNYKGKLITSEFDLGAYTKMPEEFQLVNMQGEVKGKGLAVENANFQMDASISSIGIRGYDYQNIKTDAQFAKELFEGQLSVDDPNFRFNGDATIDIREGIEEVRINAVLDTMNLRALNLSEVEASISTEVSMDIKGLEIDSLTGEANFLKTHVTYQNRDLFVDSLNIVSVRDGDKRLLDIISSAVDVHASSTIRIASFYKQLKTLYEEYRLDLRNNKDSIKAYYASKVHSDEADRTNLNFDILLKDFNPYLRLFTDDYYIGTNTSLTGNFRGGYTTILNIQTLADTLRIRGSELINASIDVSTSKIADSTNILASGYLYSENQTFLKNQKFEDLQVEAIWDNDHLRFDSFISQAGFDNDASFTGQIHFFPDYTEIRVTESEFNVIGQKWGFNVDNRVVLDSGEVQFENVILQNEVQSLSLNGVVSPNPEKTLEFEIEQFQIENLNPLLQAKLYGEINGGIQVSDLYKSRKLESDLSVKDFKVGRFLVGDIVGNSLWEEETKHLLIDYGVSLDEKNTIKLSGFVAPEDDTDQLNINAKFNEANLNFIEPFINTYFTKINGLASGDFDIRGMLNYPVLKGDGLMKEGHVKINYLNTEYDFEGFIFFDENEIGVRQLKVVDKKENLAFLNGGIFHDGFTNFILDITGEMKAFEVLNTSAKDNELYYGNAYASGTLNLLGALRNLNITANAKSEPGTKIFIPLSTSSIESDRDFISFVSKKDSLTGVTEEVTPNIDLSGLKLNFDFEITPDAYSEIIFDITSGDIIRGRGNGKLKLQIDTKGEFNMFGDYTFQEGGYNFTLSNIINKEFNINEGGRISWYGDPYEGILDLTASYEQLASLSPLMQNLDSAMLASPEIRRRYPSIVDLTLKGSLMSPDISYDIRIEDYPNSIIANGVPYSLETLVSAFDNKLKSDEQFLNKQVFSLIILRRFTEDGAFDVSGQTIGSSVSELLSNQLSYWISQVDENLEIDVDLSSFDEDALNTFQLRLSYTFLEGRLRVTRDGNFTNPDNTTSAESIIGDWTVEYLLTPDGKFRVKMFNKYNYSSFEQSLGNVSSTQTGVSLFYTQSFSDVESLIKKARKKEKQQEQKARTSSSMLKPDEDPNPEN